MLFAEKQCSEDSLVVQKLTTKFDYDICSKHLKSN